MEASVVDVVARRKELGTKTPHHHQKSQEVAQVANLADEVVVNQKFAVAATAAVVVVVDIVVVDIVVVVVNLEAYLHNCRHDVRRHIRETKRIDIRHKTTGKTCTFSTCK